MASGCFWLALIKVDHALKLTGHFEGILGLGRPQESSQNPAREAAGVHVPGFLDRANIRRFFHLFQLQGTWRSWIQHSSSSESAELSGAGTLVIEVSQCNTWPKATQSSLQVFFFFFWLEFKEGNYLSSCLKTFVGT